MVKEGEERKDRALILNTLMKFRLSYILLIFHFLSFSQDGSRGSSSEEVKTKNSGVKRALIIGISEYKASELNLNYADKDAELFKDYLIKIDSISEKHVTFLTNKEATSTNILNALAQLIEDTQEGDKVYLFFAGHGDVVDKDNVEEKIGFLLANDVNKAREYYGTQGVIPFKDINKTVNSITNKNAKIVLILDACKSGFLYLDGSQRNLEGMNNTFENSTKLLSCKPNQLSYEASDNASNIGQGFFTYYLVLGLMGAADNLVQDFNIQSFELQTFLDSNVAAATANKQSPVVKTTSSTEVLKKINSNDKSDALNQIQNSMAIRTLLSNRNDSENMQVVFAGNGETIKKFNKALEAKNYFGSESSALEIIRKIEKDPISASDFAQNLKNNLINVLALEAQSLINNYITNDKGLPDGNTLLNHGANLEVCLQLMDKNNFNYNRILVNRLFLEGYAPIRDRNYSNYPKAKKILEEALLLEPKAAYIHNALGMLANHNNEFKKSVYHYSQASELIPTWSYPVNNIGVTYFHQYQYDHASRYFEEALKLYGDNATALNNLGAVAENKGRYSEAENFYHQVKAISGGYGSVTLRNLADIYEKRGNIRKALDFYKKAMEKDSTDVYTYYNFSELLIDYKIDPEKAEKLLIKAIELEPYFSKGYGEYADFLRIKSSNREDWHFADSLYTFAIANDPYYEWGYAGKGWLLHKLNQDEAAEEIFLKSISLNGQKPDSYYNYGRFLEIGMKEGSAAEEYYQKAIEKDSFYLPAYKALVSFYNDKEAFSKSFLIIKKIAELNSEAPDVWQMMGNTYYKKGNLIQAIKSYEKTILIDSTFAKGFASLSYANLQANNYTAAIEQFKKAWTLNPYEYKLAEFSSYLLVSARRELKEGNYEKSKKLLEEAYELDKSEETSFALAEFYYLNNNIQKSISVVEAVIPKLTSKTWKIKFLDLAVRIYISGKQFENAGNLLAELLRINPRPSYDLEALILYNNAEVKQAKEKLSKVNPFLFTDTYLKKRYDKKTIQQLKEIKK
jgi:tetratricopeptide (TPR) repeat protein